MSSTTGRIVGIDLGTTFSAVSAAREGRPELLTAGNERIVPSVVGFTPGGALLVGRPAWNQLVLQPENTVRSIKRHMGLDEPVVLNGRPCRPAEISALILKEMKRIAEVNLGEAVERAVITVPAFFSDAARQATQEAGELAGFKVERILHEPTAAALAYGLDRSGEPLRVAVYDLGGGTFDVSIIDLDQGVIEVRASHGDTRLGGDDFDALLAQHLQARFQDRHGSDPAADPRAMARLLRVAEATKVALSTHPYARAREEFLLDRNGRSLHLDEEVSREAFEHLITPLLERTLVCFDQALADAGLSAQDLDRILLVGGSTRIPLVWDMLARHTGLEPMTEINPDEAVALGAGVQAAILNGEPIEAVLVDVTPHSLGIEVVAWAFGDFVADHYKVILHRNTPLPATRALPFYALYPNQDRIALKVYQGEAPVASDNTLLGEFLFEGLRPEKPGQPPAITVAFDLDANGILQVLAQDRGSKKVRQESLRAAHVCLSPSDRAASARFVETAWERGAGDSFILRRARQVLEELGRPEYLETLVQRADRALSEGRLEAAGALQDQIVACLYELEGPAGLPFSPPPEGS